ncbi:hypothetical protein [Burkholderia plantarii]|uniref:hypothetical protein n=1 Tax=Burkholderia plantarii TaxID=41899 RepID=UPI003D7F3038
MAAAPPRARAAGAESTDGYASSAPAAEAGRTSPHEPGGNGRRGEEKAGVDRRVRRLERGAGARGAGERGQFRTGRAVPGRHADAGRREQHGRGRDAAAGVASASSTNGPISRRTAPRTHGLPLPPSLPLVLLVRGAAGTTAVGEPMRAVRLSVGGAVEAPPSSLAAWAPAGNGTAIAFGAYGKAAR